MVTKVEKRRRNKRPGAPFTTSTIQQEAAKKLGFSSRRTMRAAQDLYEGIELGNEGAVGLITYMRTDSVRVADTAVASARELIQRQYGKRYLPEAPNVYSDRKNARVQGAHEAIRPTDVRRRPDEVQKYLEPDQFRLYQLIWQRFLASQMTPAQYDMTVVEFDLGKYLFRATGSVMVFDGYHVLYTEGREKEEGRQVEDLPPIPPLSQGDTVEVREITPSQHFTEPPPRFSEASLVKELERLGIGRPSTYSAIISTLSAREYVKVDQRRFFPTELGETVEKIMIGKFPEIFNVEFTSGMETELDRVEEGELGWQRVLHDFYGPFNKALGAVDMNALVSDAYGLSAEDIAKERCPKCGSQVELRTGRFGPYLACVKYKDTCDYVKSLKKARTPDRPTDEKCHLCGSPMVIKTGRVRRVPRLHHLSGVQGDPRHPDGDQVPQVRRGRSRRAADQAGQVVLGLRALPRLRLLHLEQAGARHLSRMRLRGDGEEGEQGRGGDAHLPQVQAQDRPRRARGGGAGVTASATVVGGGLAGTEAAWALAERGVRVTLHEMRPVVPTPAHRTDRLAELVCSNSFKSIDTSNAHGLLKAELRALGSVLLPCADEARVPGGTALAVDREVFSRAADEKVTAHPNITVVRGEVAELPSPGVVATGPLTSDRLAAGDRRASRLRGACVLRCDRAGGGGRVARPRPALPAVPLRQGRRRRLPERSARPRGLRRLPRRASSVADQHQGHEFDQVPYFEGCLPVEEMARRGRETLRFGPMKPVGLPDPRTGREPARRRPAAAGGQGGTDVEPGRLPDPTSDPGAAAGVPDDSRARVGGVPAIREHPPERVPEQSGEPGARRSRPGTTIASSSPASSPAWRGTPSRSAPGFSRASTWRAGWRAVRPPSPRRPPCWAGSTATSATRTRATSSR